VLALNDAETLRDWIGHVFDHPVTDPAWHWALDAPSRQDTPEQSAQLMAETFEHSGELLARFSDAQLNQGFWYLISAGCSDFIFALVDPNVPLPMRLRTIRSFVPLFEQVMARRCSPHLSHLDEEGANPLNSACYMWWDILPIYGKPEEPVRREFDTEVLKVLSQLLSIPHDACRESALHGIGHWRIYYPRLEEIVEKWLRGTPGLRPELVAYAEQAKEGCVQ
jgi:hypothetical protein